MQPVRVLGAGPAGSSAALAALSEGVSVELIEKSRFPRHKVCGEFLSPQIAEALDRLGMWPDFSAARPAPITRMALRIGRIEKKTALPEAAWGLSRYVLDHLLMDGARRRGAVLSREVGRTADVVATGRSALAPRNGRIFGFKAHFDGPAQDAVELFFFDRCYAGVSPVEGGRSNVCGLAPEESLRRVGFDPLALCTGFRPLRERLSPLKPAMKWVVAGPLVYGNRFGDPPAVRPVYPAGDALSFVDPFTGSGVLSALITGCLAGQAAARSISPGAYLAQCRKALRPAFRVAAFLRGVIGKGWAERLAPAIPAQWLFWLTRPRLR